MCPGVGGCVWGSLAWPRPISSPLHNNMLGEQCVDQSQQQKGSGRMRLVWGGGSGVVVVWCVGVCSKAGQGSGV